MPWRDGLEAKAALRRDDLGERGQFEVDSLHAPPIGIMLNAEKFSGDRSPRPPVPPPMVGRFMLIKVAVVISYRKSVGLCELCLWW